MKSAPVRAFQSSYRGGRHTINLRDAEKTNMVSIQTIANSMLELVEVRKNSAKSLHFTSLHFTSLHFEVVIVFFVFLDKACMKDISECSWLDTWIKLAKE